GGGAGCGQVHGTRQQPNPSALLVNASSTNVIQRELATKEKKNDGEKKGEDDDGVSPLFVPYPSQVASLFLNLYSSFELSLSSLSQWPSAQKLASANSVLVFIAVLGDGTVGGADADADDGDEVDGSI
ncbi:unnamed protein product, partial [Enterobius vermicularis]|uniref:Ovule protein n=1 Tax=Enterobius vermicularis TaxID=51028 RepID=A0A0N4UTU0_ENTVE